MRITGAGAGRRRAGSSAAAAPASGREVPCRARFVVIACAVPLVLYAREERGGDSAASTALRDSGPRRARRTSGTLDRRIRPHQHDDGDPPRHRRRARPLAFANA